MAYHLNTEHNHSLSLPSSADREEHSSDERGRLGGARPPASAAKRSLQKEILRERERERPDDDGG